MIEPIVLFGLACIFGLLAVRDLRAKEVGFAIVSFQRALQPVKYWISVAFEALLATLCGLLAIVAFLAPPLDCDDEVCTITLEPVAQ